MSQARRINGSALLSPKFKATGFSSNLEGRFYENNGMEASKMKKKQKKLDDAKRQKKINEMERKREQKRIEFIEGRLKANDDARRAKEEEEMRVRDSANALQGLYKCRKARMRVNLMRHEALEMEKLAMFFQSSYRGMLGRRAYSSALKNRNDSLVSRIQAIVRGRYNYKNIAAQSLFMAARKNYLATMALYRGVRGKKLFSMRQAVVREQNEMKRLKALEEARIHKAVSMIQSVVRRNMANTVMKVVREERRQKCVLIMQSVLRGKLGREKAARRRELLEEEERELEEARFEMRREEREEALKVEAEMVRVEREERRKKEKEAAEKRMKEMERERLRKLVEEEERAEEEEERRKNRDRMGGADDRVYDLDYYLDNGEDVDDTDHDYVTKYVVEAKKEVDAELEGDDGFEEEGAENVEDLGGGKEDFDDDFDDGGGENENDLA
ncbi:hypothetical protein TL16_g00547 [Triparma laevis f. inornata]|uniref:Uncharacterized protein n=1 Tax=Triparma laevis f. inornata TaxID=1714386 RepID=A0A9W7DPG2_9STRA|nr:hypothetical protein TL16_g00547 [Triparma laevis f. inornata]